MTHCILLNPTSPAGLASVPYHYGTDIVLSQKLLLSFGKACHKKIVLTLLALPWFLVDVAGGFKEFRLVERLGEGKRPAAVIGEVADDMGLDLVVLSMESIHSKHIDSNLLAEFVPCPVLLLPL
jgi:hypothetical protein